jgi:general secretion pathway protein I
LRLDCRIIKPTSNTSRGFALIEILVAVSVLTISLVVIFQLFSGGLKSRKLSEQYARGVFHAREKMAEILLIPVLSEGETQGEFEDAYEWQAVITRVVSGDDEEKLPVNLLNIKIRINWREGEKEKSFVIDTLKTAEKEKGA